MPDLYSQLLLVAAAAAAAALLTALLVRRGIYRARLVQWPPLASGISLLALAAAAVSHILLGHGYDSPEPMDPLVFLRAHPALLIVALLALFALGLGRMGGRR